ncbi:MAG: GPP34 family phosphoprotein [Pseudomonadota bacterium]|nr:GPP34 family phosphoprotein [Pseudomonadota bacterium]
MNPLTLPPLTVLEEFLLLAHDDRAEQFYPLPRSTFDCAAAGAVLMDLTLRNHLDNDLRHLFVADPSPTLDDLLDPVMQIIGLAPVMDPLPISHWLRRIAEDGESLRENALRRLEKRGILKREAKRVLWVFMAENYPILHQNEVLEVRRRFRHVILADTLPLPHDIMLTTLAQACGLFRYMLDSREFAAASPRIEQVARMDLIGQAVAKAVAEIETAMAMASGFR